MKSIKFVATFLLLLATARTAVAGPLVDVAWLKEHLAKGDVLVIDASMTKSYMEKHIPGATNVDLYLNGVWFNTSTAKMDARLQSWGLSPGKKVVLYDEGASPNATFLYYELYYAGFPTDDMSILDGGLAKWEASGGAVTQERPAAPPKGTFHVTKTRDEVRVDLNEFVTASADPSRHALVEALQPAMHFGEMKFFDRAGHVPRAVMMPVEDFYNADKTFKSPEEIRRMAAHLGIRPDREVLSYCGGGVAATVPFFGLKVLSGYPDVKVFKGSLFEWLQDDRDLPLWTYDEPHIKRDTGWLNAWNNKMMRMFGVIRINIVDIRSPEQFKVNHVPFSLNIPAEVFRKGLDDPAKLAATLGAAGVDPREETVIVSDGAVTESSALAFLALEKLGQKKVSLMMGSVDDWGMQGFPLTKEETRVGPKKSPMEISIVPVAYTAAVRADVVTKDAHDKPGDYPKIFVASGKDVPAKAQDGKVVHLPYTELLNADGTPKPAAEIWKLLAKAGVSRYAEIVAYADDPGDAAANYFVLRLMGFPDVKVLLL
ncbi:MAG: sulfurtransferase [Bacillota bacterium]